MGTFSEMDIEEKYAVAPFSEEEEEPAFEAGAAMNNMNTAVSGVTSKLSSEEPRQAGSSEAPVQVPADDQKKADEEEDAAKRREHEKAEAQRKAEWEAKQQAKKDAEREQLEKIASMSDQDVMTTSMQRIGADTERLTRRNMKECVSEYIQTLCLSDPAFARRAMHPRKSMIHCIWYINRKAKEFVEKEMKDNGIRPERNGIYGSDVPDDLCYQWAEEYFNDPNAKEDQEEEEKFVPKPYHGKTKTPTKTSSNGKGKKAEEKKTASTKVSTARSADSDQIT